MASECFCEVRVFQLFSIQDLSVVAASSEAVYAVEDLHTAVLAPPHKVETILLAPEMSLTPGPDIFMELYFIK